jgi:hypothetical protein
MTRRVAKLLAVSFLLCSVYAAHSVFAGSEAACCAFTSQCATMTDDDVYNAALSRKFGTCYVHEQCPGCACPFYVKVSYYNDPKGFDGGTGCLFNKADVIRTLRQLCQDGVCCCPRAQVPKGECPSTSRVWAKDPLTGTCCEYANSCAAPAGWPQFSSQGECQGVF